MLGAWSLSPWRVRREQGVGRNGTEEIVPVIGMIPAKNGH